MKLIVPFIYEALIIKPRCRKPSLAIIKDSVEIEIKEVKKTDLPVAFKVGNSELRWDGEELWDIYYHQVSGKPPELAHADEIKRHTESNGQGYKWSCNGPKSPFHNFWNYMTDTMLARHGIPLHGMFTRLEDEEVQIKADVVYREWLDDNREAVIEEAKALASGLRLVDDVLYHPVGEPRYVCVTFGLGNNHGGTGLFVDRYYNSNLRKEAYFSALEYDKACEYADSVAARRGDNESIPVRVRSGEIQVLIPEAVKVNPKEQHGDGCEFMNSIEDGINAAGPLGGLAVAVSKLSE